MAETWAVEYRQQWIAETIEIFGSINREHICKKFRVSLQQASLDLSLFQDRNPQAITYDKSAKMYRSTAHD